MAYNQLSDKRDTSNGMTPAKTISRSKPLPTVKPIAGNYLKKQMPRKNQGK